MPKLSRRSFLGILSAIPLTPLVAKDMGDFEFLPPASVTKLSKPVPVVKVDIEEQYRPAPMGVAGEIRFNTDTNQFEVCDGKKFYRIIV